MRRGRLIPAAPTRSTAFVFPPEHRLVKTPPTRRPTLVDAMILVAAAALGCAGIRAEQTRHLHPSVMYFERPVDPAPADTTLGSIASVGVSYVSLAGPTSGPISFRDWFQRARMWAETSRLVAPCLAALSPALLIIRLRRPRPAWPHLIHQAGWVASLNATLALGIQVDHVMLALALEHYSPSMMMSTSGPTPSRISWIACQATGPYLIGMVVLISWLALLLGGQQRRERSWIDRTGIAVGLGWVALLLADFLRNESI